LKSRNKASGGRGKTMESAIMQVKAEVKAEHAAIDKAGKVQADQARQPAKPETLETIASDFIVFSQRRELQADYGRRLYVWAKASGLQADPKSSLAATITDRLAKALVLKQGGKPEDYSPLISACMMAYRIGEKIKAKNPAGLAGYFNSITPIAADRAMREALGLEARKAGVKLSASQKAEKALQGLTSDQFTALFPVFLSRFLVSCTASEFSALADVIKAESTKRQPIRNMTPAKPAGK